MLENVFPSTARLRRGVSRSGTVVPRTYTITVCICLDFSFTRGTILTRERYICRPVSKARTLLCTDRLVREAVVCAGRQVCQPVRSRVLFLKGSCVWNQLGHFSLEFPSFISDQVVKRFRFIPISTLNRLQSSGFNLRYGSCSLQSFLLYTFYF
jgi:hypothetical protein